MSADRPSSHPVHVDLHDRAAMLGHWCWIERRLFEVLGTWASSDAEPRAAVFFGEASARHGWHAGLWFDRLPELADVDAEGLVVPPGPATESLMEGIAALEDPAGTLERLAAVHRCALPALVTEYRGLLSTVSAVSEGSLHRWGSLVVADDTDEWVRGEELIRALVGDDGALGRVLDAQRRTEADLLRADRFTR